MRIISPLPPIDREPANFHALPDRAQSSAPRRTSTRPVCAETPHDWDLDVGTPESWRRAVALCRTCPLLNQCERLAQDLLNRGDGPRSMIWAGIGFDAGGRMVLDLDRYRAAPPDHQRRPIRIIHNGDRPHGSDSDPVAPRRHFVLGRPLPPTATA